MTARCKAGNADCFHAATTTPITYDAFGQCSKGWAVVITADTDSQSRVGMHCVTSSFRSATGDQSSGLSSLRSPNFFAEVIPIVA